MRDVAGSVMAIYRKAATETVALQQEIPIYGASRLGVYYKIGGHTNYQLTDHLGNVRAVVKKTDPNPSIFADYYPFGMQMPDRNSQGDYRYAFQGQEKDTETGKEAFQLRLWDSRIGRWLTTDPKHEFSSPYLGMGNNPISLIDPDGGSTCRKNGKVVDCTEYGFSPLFNLDLTMPDGSRPFDLDILPAMFMDINPNHQRGLDTRIRDMNQTIAMRKSRSETAAAFAAHPFTQLMLMAMMGPIEAGGMTLAAAEARFTTQAFVSSSRFTNIYRAVSKSELDDIALNGFRVKEGGYEFGKLFANTVDEAAEFGRLNFAKDGIPNHIISVKIDKQILEKTYKFHADGMNAISVDKHLFQELNLHMTLKASPLK